MKLARIAAVASIAGAALVGMGVTRAQDLMARIDADKARLASIESRTTRVADIDDIEKLQRIFGYYFDKMLWEQVIDLFSDDATMELGFSGVYEGKDSIRRYLYALSGGKQGPLEGVLFNHMQLEPIITVADDGLSAKGRWKALILTGVSGEGSGGNWGTGPYENEYVKQDGVWKISKIHWYATFVAPYEGGWLEPSTDGIRKLTVAPGVTPDRPPSEAYHPYPGVEIPPFDYKNPGLAQ